MAMKTFLDNTTLPASDINEYLVNTKYAVKPSNTTRTGTTLSDDPDLQLPIDASKTYLLDLLVPFQGGNGGLKFTFTGSGGNSLYGYWQVQFSATGAPGPLQGGSYDTVTYNLGFNFTVTTMSGFTAPDTLIVRGFLLTAGTAGTLTFRWCQNSSSGNLTAVAGAAMLLRRVS